MNMQQRALQWLFIAAGSARAVPLLAFVSFANSSFFPVTPVALLIPMGIARREMVMRLAHICLVTAVLGGFVGYATGYFFMDTLGQWLLGSPSMQADFAALQAWYERWGVWAMAMAGFTPAPYKLFAIASGALGMDLPAFLVASMVNRGLRFYTIAVPIHFMGDRVRVFLETRLNLALGICLCIGLIIWLLAGK